MKRIEPFAPRRGTPLPTAFDLLAIDPGEHTGWAAFDTTLIACGLGDPPVSKARCLVIELPQVYPSHPVPPNDLVTLAFLAGRYVGAREAFAVFPRQWKGNLPKGACAARVRAKLSPEERAVVDECACKVPEKQMHNVMDAVGIGLFAEGRVF